jgi:PadR family transcriptional regulator PadR
MRDRINQFEFFVILAVMRLKNAAYGVQVSQEMSRHLRGKEIAVASVYAALDRLESKGWVKRKLGDATPVRGGKAKTYFSATPKGVAQVRASRRSLMSFWNGIALLE